MAEKTQQQDISNKTVLDNPELCCQFIKDNIDIPILKNLRPEDIEDCTELFRSYFGVEYESDSVKRIKIRDVSENEQEFEFFLVSLVEHKSKVDYNVVVQLLKYMTCIWAEYEKTFGTDYKNQVKTKGFRYPPILPIVYYEGTERWTAATHLKERIFMYEFFEEYIPDFTYYLVNLSKISKEELLSREDQMSLIMLVNKIQNAAELNEFLKLPEEQITAMMKKAPEAVVDIIAMCVQVLCTKLNLSTEETEKCVEKVRSKSMGYMWENMEKIDVQAMRKEVEKAKKLREEAEEIIRKADGIIRKAGGIRQEADEKMQEADEKMQEADEKMQEADEKMQEADEKAKKAEEDKQAIVAKLKNAQGENERLRKLLETQGGSF